MRVLWVTAEPPDRDGGGGNIRQALLFDRLTAAGHEVDLLVSGGPPDAQVAGEAHSVVLCPIQAPPARGPWDARLRDLRSAVHGGPAERLAHVAARAALARSWPSAPADVVLIEHAGLAPLIDMRRPQETWVCTLHNVASGTSDAVADLTDNWRERLVRRRDAAQARRLERQVLTDFDLVLSVSDEDAELLPGATTVIPNGVDLSRFRPTPLPHTPTLLFTGTLSYLPNVDGLTWFCSEVLPMLREAVPGLVFTIVGRDPVPEVLALQSLPSVQLHRDVPSVVPFLEAAQACVVPLRMGTGSRLKALEAMSAGRPLVGTTIGLSGLGLVDEAVVVDDPGEMARRITELLGDRSRAETLAARGRTHVESHFGWTAIGDEFVAALERAGQRR